MVRIVKSVGPIFTCSLKLATYILSHAREAGSPLKAAAQPRQEGHPRTVYSTSGKTDGILLRQGGSGTPQYVVYSNFQTVEKEVPQNLMFIFSHIGSNSGTLNRQSSSPYRTPAPPVSPPSVPSNYAPSYIAMQRQISQQQVLIVLCGLPRHPI